MSYKELNEKQLRTANILLASNTKVSSAVTALLRALEFAEEINVEFDVGTTDDGEFSVLFNDNGIYFTCYKDGIEYRSIKG